MKQKSTENNRTPSGRLYLAAAAVLALALVLFAVWQFTRPAPVEGLKNVTVEVTHSDGSTAEFAYQTDLEYLGELLVQKGLISGSDSAYGLFVDTVDGETADYAKDGGWWQLTCNGAGAETGADGVVLQDGDVYGWIYTIG